MHRRRRVGHVDKLHPEAALDDALDWMEDQISSGVRNDVQSLNNAGRPWFFFGMGCHIADWAQNTVLTSTTPQERSLSEKFLIKPRSAASAAYANDPAGPGTGGRTGGAGVPVEPEASR